MSDVESNKNSQNAVTWFEAWRGWDGVRSSDAPQWLYSYLLDFSKKRGQRTQATLHIFSLFSHEVNMRNLQGPREFTRQSISFFIRTYAVSSDVRWSCTLYRGLDSQATTGKGRYEAITLFENDRKWQETCSAGCSIVFSGFNELYSDCWMQKWQLSWGTAPSFLNLKTWVSIYILPKILQK